MTKSIMDRFRPGRLGVVLCLGLMVGVSALQAQEDETLGLATYRKGFSLTLTPGMIKPVDGDYADHASMAKAAPFGLGLELGINYRLFRYLSLSLTAVENWIPVAKDYQPNIYKSGSPAFLLPAFSLSGIIHLGVGYAVEPYLRVGGGISPWRFSKSGFTGNTWSAPSRPGNDFSDLSPEVHGGFGIETLRFGKFAMIAELRYTYVFTRNPAKFGTDDFTEQDFLSLFVGLIFHFK